MAPIFLGGSRLVPFKKVCISIICENHESKKQYQSTARLTTAGLMTAISHVACFWPHGKTLKVSGWPLIWVLDHGGRDAYLSPVWKMKMCLQKTLGGSIIFIHILYEPWCNTFLHASTISIITIRGLAATTSFLIWTGHDLPLGHKKHNFHRKKRKKKPAMRLKLNSD